MKKYVKFILTMLLLTTSICSIQKTASQAATKPKSITLSEKTYLTKAGNTFQLKVKKVLPKNASTSIKWYSSNDNIATVNSKGKVSAKAEGNVTITAQSKNNKKVSASCKVTIFPENINYYGGYKQTVWTIDSDGLLTVTGKGDMYPYNDYYHELYMPKWCNYSSYIKEAKINVTGAKNLSNFFYKCTNLEKVDLSKLDTSNVKYMFGMFLSCTHLKSLDLKNFNTSNVSDMCCMFENCQLLSSIDLSNFDTYNVTVMSEMFMSCISLSSLDLSNFNTYNVTLMNSMFQYCESLNSIVLDSFDTSNVTQMVDMFYGCKSLSSIDLHSFNTSNVTFMDDMFNGCESLSSIDLKGFDISNVIRMNPMFDDCNMLSTIITPKKTGDDNIYLPSIVYTNSGTKNIVWSDNNSTKQYIYIPKNLQESLVLTRIIFY